MDLDQPEDFGRIDRADALADVEAAADQWETARGLAGRPLDLAGIDGIVISGMGGSGICGDVAAALGAGRPGAPIHVHKTYGLPAFAGPRTLVAAVSHSGDTEETVSSLEAALGRGSRIFAVTSGGAVAKLCEEHGAPWIAVPDTGQPRHSLGYLAVPVLAALGLDDGLGEAISLQREVARECGRSVPIADNAAKQLATRLAGAGLPVIYGARGLGSVAGYRLKCQLNENAELPALVGELPEINHNEIVAWQASSPLTDAAGLVCVRDPAGEHERIKDRFAITEELIAERFAWRYDIVARGRAPLARLASLIALIDFASVYTAIALDRDPTPIASITRLKRQLAG